MAQIRPDTLPKLTGNNYAAWKSEMLDLLALAGLEDTVVADNRASAANVRKALAAIRLAVSNAIKPQLLECATALDAWDALAERYKQQSEAAVLQLQQALLNVRMKSGETLADYRSRVQELWAAATAGGAAVEEQHVVVSFLAGLAHDYEAVADSLAARGINDLDEAELALMAVEQRILSRNGRDQKNLTKTLTTAFRANQQQRTGVCWTCGEPGHYRQDCPKRKKQQHAALRGAFNDLVL
ncbi:MAG: hypothetical protein ACRC1H_06045 [Caldilineaceae bacterium]